MKVTLEKDYRKYYTLDDLDRAKMVIAYEKTEDYEKIEQWVEYAVNEAGRDNSEWCEKVLDATARTARNDRVWDAYGEGTGNMDVWIEFLARTSNGFIDGGAYLSDIWQTGAIPYAHHMYFRYARYEER